MPSRRLLHSYQKEALRFTLDRIESHKGAGLWLDPGLGKTIVALNAIMALKMLNGIKHTTVIAPSRVLQTSWPNEIADWNLPLTYSWIKGDERERQRALDAKPDIYFIGCESLAEATVDNSFIGDGYTVKFHKGQFVLSIGDSTLKYDSIKKLISENPQCADVASKRFRQRTQLPTWLDKAKYATDFIVIDEVTKFKNWSAARTKYLRKLLQRIPLRMTLTGTPVPTNLGEDIFPQQFILDNGKTLGTAITRFRDSWMRSCGYENREWEMVPSLIPTFLDLISPWYLRQEILDHLDMPELVNNEIEVVLPEAAMATYKKIEKEMYAELDDNELVALSGGSKYNLSRQIASGSAYDTNKGIADIHDAKLEALADLFEELNGKPLLVAYNFTHELQKLRKRWPKIAYIAGGVKDTAGIIADWRSGKIKLLAAQIQALSHGVNGLQSANDVCYFSPTDRPEDREQFTRRIWRQGVTGQVRIHHLLAKGTLDFRIKRTLDDKDATQRDVLKAVKNGRTEALTPLR